MSEQPLARSEVELALDFDDLDDELQRDLSRRVKRAAATAEKEINRIPRASRRAGKQIADDLGAGTAAAARQVRRAARQVEQDLQDAADAGDELGDNVDASARRATAALGRVERAAQQLQGALFDIGDDGGFVQIERGVEAVQQALFDIDSVEIERVEHAATRAGRSLRGSLARGLRDVAGGLADVAKSPVIGGGILLRSISRIAPEAIKAKRGLTDLRGVLVSLVATAALVAPAIAAGGAGVAAFAALAIPTYARVIRAQTEMLDTWGALSRAERVSAAATGQLVDEYRELGRALAPESLRVYNGLLANTSLLLPRLAPLARNTAVALQNANQAIGEGFESDRATRFFGFLSAEAGPAVEALTRVLIDLVAAAASVITALAPLAGVTLDVVSALASMVTVVGDLAPGLLQFLAVMLAVRSPVALLSSSLGRATGGFKEFAKANRGASLAQKGLNLLTAAGPNLYLAAGAAVAFFALKLASATTAAERLVQAEFAINRAVGNNLRGYREVAKVLGGQLEPVNNRVAASLEAVQRSATATNVQLAQGALAVRGLTDANVAAGAGLQQARTAMDNVKQGAEALALAVGGTQTQAIQLANAIGLNLSKAVTENGQLTAAAADKVYRYQEAVRLAADPQAVLNEAISQANNRLLTMTERVEGLNNAFEAAFAPTLAYYNAQTRIKDAAAQANKTFKDSKATLVQRRDAFTRLATTLQEMATAEFRAQGNVDAASAAFNKQLPLLQKLAGNSKSGKRAIDELREVLRGMGDTSVDAQGKIKGVGDKAKQLPKTKKVKVEADTKAADTRLQGIKKRLDELQSKTVTVTINEQRVQSGGSPGSGIGGFARGGMVFGPGTGRSDSILARLSNGEFVVNATATRRHLALLRAINSNRYADGGLVGLPRFATGGRVTGRGTRVDVVLGLRLPVGEAKTLRNRLQTVLEQVGGDFRRSLLGTPSQINSAVKSLVKRLQTAFRGLRTRRDDGLISFLQRSNKRLQSLAKERDSLVARIEQAQELAASTTSEARTFAGLSSFDEAERASGDSIAKTLRDRLAAIQAFQRDIEHLARRGLDKSLLQQIVEGGPDAGAEVARTLRDASGATLSRINSVQRQITKATSALGQRSADLLFDAGKQASKGFLSGLQADRKRIVALMTEIAESVSATVRKTLKIKSPSRVLDRDAQDTMAGYIQGLRRLRERVQSELARTVAPGREVERARTLAPPAARELARTAAPERQAERPVTVQQTNHIHNVLDPRAVVDIIEGRLVAALR